MNLLLVGLESIELPAESLACRWVDSLIQVEAEGHAVQSIRLPSNWDGCFAPLQSRLGSPWDAVVVFAEKDAGSIAIERIAINETDVSQKDSEGRRPRGKAIETAGEAGYWTTLPYRELASRLTSARFAASSSHSAGTSLANFVCYKLLHELAKRGSRTPAGLIHLPKAQKVGSRDEAKEFLSALLDSLGTSASGNDKLRIDLDRLSQRLGVENPLSSENR